MRADLRLGPGPPRAASRATGPARLDDDPLPSIITVTAYPYGSPHALSPFPRPPPVRAPDVRRAVEPPRLTARQQQILDWIRGHIEATGMPPTRAEIATGLGFSTASSAEDHLQALAKKGALELTPGTSRGLRLRDLPGVPMQGTLPLVGRVAAGSPILAAEHIEAPYRIDAALFSPHADYLLRVRGASMQDAGILDGDLLAVHKTAEARSGQIVVARAGRRSHGQAPETPRARNHAGGREPGVRADRRRPDEDALRDRGHRRGARAGEPAVLTRGGVGDRCASWRRLSPSCTGKGDRHESERRHRPRARCPPASRTCRTSAPRSRPTSGGSASARPTRSAGAIRTCSTTTSAARRIRCTTHACSTRSSRSCATSRAVPRNRGGTTRPSASASIPARRRRGGRRSAHAGRGAQSRIPHSQRSC